MNGKILALLLLAQVALMSGKVTKAVAPGSFGFSKLITRDDCTTECNVLKRWMLR